MEILKYFSQYDPSRNPQTSKQYFNAHKAVL
jgi:hypothetical protein